MTDPTRYPLACLPVPRGAIEGSCPLCQGAGHVALSTPPGPRQCPTCRGSGIYVETWLTEGGDKGMLQRARQLGLAA